MRQYFNFKFNAGSDPHQLNSLPASNLNGLDSLHNKGPYSGSQRGDPNMEKELREQIGRLNSEVGRLGDELKHKDALVRQLQGWVESDKLVLEDGTPMVDLMEEQRVKLQAI
jgi:hypothetical protein